MKALTIKEYEKLQWEHVMCDLTPLVMGTDLMSSWCNDHKIIVTRNPEKIASMIPYDKENFARGYVKRPKIEKSMIVLLRCEHCKRYMKFDLAQLKVDLTPTCNTCSAVIIKINGWVV